MTVSPTARLFGVPLGPLEPAEEKSDMASVAKIVARLVATLLAPCPFSF